MESQDSKKQKILYVITNGVWGGAERYVYDLAVNAPDNFEVFVAVGEPKEKQDLQDKLKQTNPKIQIIQLKHLVRPICPWHDILAVFELKKLYKSLKPDVVHLNSSKAGIIGSLANWSFQWKIFYTVHGWVFNEPSRKLGRTLYHFLEKWTAKFKNKIIVLSEKEYNDGLNLGIDKNKLIKIPLGIELPKFLEKNEARNKIATLTNCQIDSKIKLIGTIANFYKSKGLDILIEAARLLSLRGQSLKQSPGIATPSRLAMIFVVIGDGPERKNLEQLIKKYNLTNIKLLGNLENASQYLPAFDIFLLTSRKEGLPYTILETMAAQQPIVATDVGGIPEVIENEKTGLLSPASPKLIANNLNRLLTDESLKNSLTNNNQFNFTLNQMLGTTYECYWELTTD